jgi:hypothetical protein
MRVGLVVGWLLMELMVLLHSCNASSIGVRFQYYNAFQETRECNIWLVGLQECVSS